MARLYDGVGANLTEVVDSAFPQLGTENLAEPARFGVDRSDARHAGLRRHLQAVDTALTGHVDTDRPLLVVGTGRRASLFRKHSHHRTHLTETLPVQGSEGGLGARAVPCGRARLPREHSPSQLPGGW